VIESQIDEYKTIAKVNLEEALEKLLSIEKSQRLAADAIGTKKVCVAIVQVCFFARKWKTLNEHIVLLSKRRAQLKQAVVGMVQEAMTYIDQLDDLALKTELIETLSTVTAGKIYVEVERARLVRQLAGIKEDSGDIDAAAEAMQEVAVETYGAMAKTEKVAFILEQVRLCLDKKDFVRGTILSKKISTRTFVEKEEKKVKKEKKEGEVKPEDSKPDKEDNDPQKAPPEQPPLEGTPTMPELKLMYYALLIRINIHASEYLEVCRCYQSVFQDPQIQLDPTRWQPVLKKICWYVVLASYGTEQQSMLHSVAGEKKLGDLPAFQCLVKLFTTNELIRWPSVKSTYEEEMNQEEEIFGGESGAKRVADIRQRCVEHNILVIQKYYQRINLTRLAELLDVDQPTAERHLSEMVVAKTVTAKLDRPAGIVDFVGKRDAAGVLNEWAANIDRVLNLVDLSCHQIHKECMLHKVTIA